MDQIQPILILAQQQFTRVVEQLAPYSEIVKTHVLKAAEPLLPYYAQAHVVLQENLVIADPYIQQGLTYLAPVGTALVYGQSLLPELKGYPVNYVGIAVIVLHVLLYNFIAQLEYKTKIYTKIFGRLAIYLNIAVLVLSALVRDHYLMRAIEKDAGSRVIFEAETASCISTWLIGFGIFLNLWVLACLGLKSMYNGDSFGYTLKAPVTGGPFYFFDDPQYFGTTLCLLGYAVKYQSRIGYGLTGVMYLVFSFSVLVLEGPHMKSIYDTIEKQKPKKEKTKAKKNN